MDFEAKYWHLIQFKLAKRLSKAERVHMCQTMEMKYYKKGADIPLEGKQVSSNVYFLKNGTIKITSYSNDGNEIIKNIVKRGDIFGTLGLFEAEDEEDYVVAMEDAVVCIIDSGYFKKLMENNRNLNNYIFKLAGLRIKKLERNLTSLLYKDATTRIKDFIIDYVKDFGLEKEDIFLARNLLSNNDIGILTSTSRQTVNKTLNNLKRNNVIDFDKNTIKVNKKAMQK